MGRWGRLRRGDISSDERSQHAKTSKIATEPLAELFDELVAGDEEGEEGEERMPCSDELEVSWPVFLSRVAC